MHVRPRLLTMIRGALFDDADASDCALLPAFALDVLAVSPLPHPVSAYYDASYPALPSERAANCAAEADAATAADAAASRTFPSSAAQFRARSSSLI